MVRWLIVATLWLATALPGETAEALPPEIVSGLNAEQSAALLAAIPQFRRMMDGKLLDYPSARFMDTTAVVATNAGETNVFACGAVNSKNSAGGYVGWRKFAMFADFIVIEGDYPEGTTDAAYANSTLKFACNPGKKGLVGVTHWDFSSRLQFAP